MVGDVTPQSTAGSPRRADPARCSYLWDAILVDDLPDVPVLLPRRLPEPEGGDKGVLVGQTLREHIPGGGQTAAASSVPQTHKEGHAPWVTTSCQFTSWTFLEPTSGLPLGLPCYRAPAQLTGDPCCGPFLGPPVPLQCTVASISPSSPSSTGPTNATLPPLGQTQLTVPTRSPLCGFLLGKARGGSMSCWVPCPLYWPRFL